MKESPAHGEVAVLPIDSDGNEKVWTCSPETAREELDDMRADADKDSHIEIYKKYRPNQDGALPGTWWDDPGYSSSESGTKVLKDLFGSKVFDYPKSINLVVDCLRVCNVDRTGTVLDYFGGSGTTAHAVINLNREDAGARKYILVEMGEYVDTVLKPRILKAAFSEEWKDGAPVRANPPRTANNPYNGLSHCLKVVRLESY